METMSPTIGALALALSKAQGDMGFAKKDSANPYFKSSYADLASCWEACRKPLADNGLAVIQTTEQADAGGIVIVTTLAHESGEWIRSRLRMMPSKPDAQAIGSVITYARRYALAAIVGLAQADDDAESAMDRSKPAKVDPAPVIAKLREHLAGTDVLKTAWTALSDAERKAVAHGAADEWDALKAEAAKGDADAPDSE